MLRTFFDPMPEISRHLSGRFTYVDLQNAEAMYLIPFGFHGWVCVMGHPADGTYEWVGRLDGTDARYANSDDGFGDPASAMRSGLVAMLD